MGAFVSQFSRGTAVRKPVAKPVTPKAPTAPASAPQRPTAPPPDATYEATIGGLSRQRDVNMAGLEQQRQQGLLNYGYTQDAGGGIAFDATNPYSQAALLKRHYDQARAGNTTSYAAQGQLYSGALQNAQAETNFGESQGSDALQKQLMAFLANNLQSKAQAGVDYEAGYAQAGASRLDRAADNSLYAAQTDAANAVAAAARAPASGGDPVVQEIPHTDSTGRKGVIKVHKSGKRVFVPRG